jgi:hypothetical protein
VIMHRPAFVCGPPSARYQPLKFNFDYLTLW